MHLIDRSYFKESSTLDTSKDFIAPVRIHISLPKYTLKLIELVLELTFPRSSKGENTYTKNIALRRVQSWHCIAMQFQERQPEVRLARTDYK